MTQLKTPIARSIWEPLRQALEGKGLETTLLGKHEGGIAGHADLTYAVIGKPEADSKELKELVRAAFGECVIRNALHDLELQALIDAQNGLTPAYGPPKSGPEVLAELRAGA